MRQIGHFAAGKRVEGRSGRFADVYAPHTGEVQARVALASADEVAEIVANAKAAQPAWAAQNPQKRARVMMKFLEVVAKEMKPLAGAAVVRARKNVGGQPGRHSARAGSGRVRHRRAASHEGRVHGLRRPRHRHVFDAPAAGRGGGHHAVQLSRHDPAVEGSARHRLRQRVRAEAVRARPQRADTAGGAVHRGGPAGGHLQRRERR